MQRLAAGRLMEGHVYCVDTVEEAVGVLAEVAS
jgi:hypothetical protein